MLVAIGQPTEKGKNGCTTADFVYWLSNAGSKALCKLSLAALATDAKKRRSAIAIAICLSVTAASQLLPRCDCNKQVDFKEVTRY